MAILRSQGGAALITALMLTVLSLVIALALLTMITTRTQVSASQKRYRSSLQAAQGGAELLAREVLPRMLQTSANVAALEKDYAAISLKVTQNPCLQQKLDFPATKWTQCSPAQVSTDPTLAPDVRFRLSGIPPAKGFSVTTKIVDTVPGNTDRSGHELLDLGGAVASQDEIIHPQHVPAMYNLSVQGVREEEGVREKARLSVLYAY